MEHAFGSESPNLATQRLRPGEVFAGRYRVVAPLGRGGMGDVFQARDLAEPRGVAIKVLQSQVGARQRARFAREGALIAGLRHPGIVGTYGGGLTQAGRPYLVLELIEGARDLAEAIAADPERNLEMLLEVCRAVGYAHSRGVVHRDLKPDNVLVDRAGQPKVVDFGLGWHQDQAQLTRTGAIVGTPLFMAPECYGGGGRDPRVDVWSLGVMLYQALTGELPFSGVSFVDLAAQVAQTRPEPPRRLNPEVSRELEAVCLRALAKDPADRFPDADALADALARALREPAPRRARGVVPAALAAGALALAFAAGAWASREAPSAGPSPGSSAEGAAATAAGTPAVRAAPSAGPARQDLERALRLVAARAHEPTGLREGVVRELDRLLEGAPDASFAARVRVERLGYLFRRGRWEHVATAGQRLEGEARPRGLLLAAFALRELRKLEDAAALLRAHFAEREPRSALDWAVGALGATYAKDAALAIHRADKALELDPRSLPARIARATAWGMQGRLPEVQRELEALDHEVPDHPVVIRLLNVLAQNRLDDGGVYETSLRLLRITEPEPPMIVLRDHAIAAMNMKAFAEARRVLERALTLAPRDFRARWVLQILGITSTGQLRPEHLEGLLELRREDPREFQEYLEAIDGPLRVNLERRLAGRE